jgi:tRNA threonylcarbamoyladenosine biosynthesis protein TsaB
MKQHMPNILAVDTSTEFCSVALDIQGQIEQRCERIPRKHNQRLFTMLREILPDGDLSARGLDCLAWACGPGSFTGLRIAASAVQGLAFAHSLPVAGISTLACVAQGLYRRGDLSPVQHALVVLDARINEIYWGLYGCDEGIDEGVAISLMAEGVGSPSQLPLIDVQQRGEFVVCGDGLQQLEETILLQAGAASLMPEAAPAALDLLPLARAAYAQGALVDPEQVQPVYLRDKIGWKKLSEQG